MRINKVKVWLISLVLTNFYFMKKLLLVISFLLLNVLSYAPTYNSIFIMNPEPINKTSILESKYKDLITALVKVESDGNNLAINKLEGAHGAFQIRQCRIEHYNKLTGNNYTVQDMHDYNKAKEVFLYFAEGKSFEKAAKNWNGSGPMTEIYWNKVKANLPVRIGANV